MCHARSDDRADGEDDDRENAEDRAASGHTKRRYLPYGTRAMARPPMTTADVGVTRFSRPDALWYAVTTRLRSAPAKSASGAMIGMATVARPDDDGIRNDSGRNSRYMTIGERRPRRRRRAPARPSAARCR